MRPQNHSDRSPQDRSVRLLRRRCAGQAGVGLLEVLAAMAVLAITASGIVTAIFLTLNVSDTSRLTSRVNSLSTSFGEALKVLPYQVCGSASDYQSAFVNADQRKVSGQRLTAVPGATLTVQAVADNGSGDATCPYDDSGTQVITINVALKGMSHTAKVVKRTPSPNSPPPTIDFEVVRRTPDNSPYVTFGLIPRVSSAVGIYLYEWWCDGTWASTTPQGVAPSPTTTSADANDPRPACGPILAPIGVASSRIFALRVTDLSGVTWPAVWKTVQIPPTIAGAPPPTAKITQISSPACTTDDRCAANTPVVFDGRFSKAGDGRSLVKCVWNFADGSPPQVSVGPDCGSSTYPKTQTYIGKGTYNVTLTVTDDLGQTNMDTRPVTVDGPALVRPTVKIGGSVYGGSYSTQVTAVAPQRVQFQSDGTHGNNGATIKNYEWTFGDGGTAQGETKTTSDWKYQSPTTGANCDGGAVGYKATLTVTDSNDIKNSASMCVSIGAIPPPFGATGFGFKYTSNRVGCCHWPPPILWLQLNFQWQRIPVPDGTPIGDLSIEVEISSSFNMTCWLGTRTATFPNAQPPPGQPTKTDNIKLWGLGGLFEGATVALGDDCEYKARTIRVYEGQSYTSDWSPSRRF